MAEGAAQEGLVSSTLRETLSSASCSRLLGTAPVQCPQKEASPSKTQRGEGLQGSSAPGAPPSSRGDAHPLRALHPYKLLRSTH